LLKHAPGKGAVRAAALERQIDAFGGRRGFFSAARVGISEARTFFIADGLLWFQAIVLKTADKICERVGAIRSVQ
jgi:hypothetical protein